VRKLIGTPYLEITTADYPLLRIRATPGPVLRILRSRPKDWMRRKNVEYISFSGGKRLTEARAWLNRLFYLNIVAGRPGDALSILQEW
jgi:hypothetical protein